MKKNLLSVLLLAVCIFSLGLLPVGAQSETECEAGFRLITHELGETCVSEDVQRVVTLENSMTESVVTLGVQPVGVADIELYNTLVNLSISLSAEVVDVGSRSEPNLEIIAGLNPDLIIAASWRVTENYDELSAIAPTITFVGSESLETMSDYFTTIALALNREAEAQQILAAMDQHFAEAAASVSNTSLDPNFVLAHTWYEDSVATFRVFIDASMPVEILSRIGLENTWEAESNPDGYTVVGIEALGAIENTNFLFLTDPDSAPFYEESPLWNALPFVQAGTAYRLNDDLWLFGGPLSAQKFVDAVLQALGVAEAEVAATSAECEAGFRLFDHEYLATDPVCIPENPQRVVALENAAFELLLYSDKEIVGTFQAFTKDELSATLPVLAETIAPIPGADWPINLELALEWSPDLIAAYSNETMPYDQLSQIAPTVIFNAEIGGGNWQAATEFWSEVFNMQDVYAEMSATYAARVAELQAALGEDRAETEVSLVLASSYFNMIILNDSPIGSILSDVGFARPEAQSLPTEEAVALYGNAGFAYLSDETLNLADGDVIFLYTFPALGEEAVSASNQYLDDFEANPLWQSLGAVSGDQVQRVGYHWTRANTYLQANAVLDDLFATLTDTEPTIPNPIADFAAEGE